MSQVTCVQKWKRTFVRNGPIVAVDFGFEIEKGGGCERVGVDLSQILGGHRRRDTGMIVGRDLRKRSLFTPLIYTIALKGRMAGRVLGIFPRTNERYVPSAVARVVLSSVGQ